MSSIHTMLCPCGRADMPAGRYCNCKACASCLPMPRVCRSRAATRNPAIAAISTMKIGARPIAVRTTYGVPDPPGWVPSAAGPAADVRRTFSRTATEKNLRSHRRAQWDPHYRQITGRTTRGPTAERHRHLIAVRRAVERACARAVITLCVGFQHSKLSALL